jgi:hypothetical protein
MKITVVLLAFILSINSLFSQNDYENEGAEINYFVDLGLHTTIISKDLNLKSYGGHLGYYGNKKFGFAFNFEYGNKHCNDTLIIYDFRVISIDADVNYLLSKYFAIGSGVGIFNYLYESTNTLDVSNTYLQIPLNLKVYLFDFMGFSLGYRIILGVNSGNLPNNLNFGVVFKIH